MNIFYEDEPPADEVDTDGHMCIDLRCPNWCKQHTMGECFDNRGYFTAPIYCAGVCNSPHRHYYRVRMGGVVTLTCSDCGLVSVADFLYHKCICEEAGQVWYCRRSLKNKFILTCLQCGNIVIN